MTLSPLDDYPVHQAAQPIRYPATSDRNFYDRYYFNCHAGTDELMLIVGVGQYPNLGVTDAFALARHGNIHRVVRASRELGADRMDTTVGPFKVEVIEGLRRLRVVLAPNEHGLEFDLTWDAVIPAQAEPQHYIRQQERVIFDSFRLAQTGRWTGRVRSGDQEFTITPDRWRGSRDRSWGVRQSARASRPESRSATRRSSTGCTRPCSSTTSPFLRSCRKMRPGTGCSRKRCASGRRRRDGLRSRLADRTTGRGTHRAPAR